MSSPTVARARFVTAVPVGAIETLSVAAKPGLVLTQRDGGLRIEQKNKLPLWVPSANLRWVEFSE